MLKNKAYIGYLNNSQYNLKEFKSQIIFLKYDISVSYENLNLINNRNIRIKINSSFKNIIISKTKI